jgi:hypothetical protein
MSKPTPVMAAMAVVVILGLGRPAVAQNPAFRTASGLIPQGHDR